MSYSCLPPGIERCISLVISDMFYPLSTVMSTYIWFTTVMSFLDFPSRFLVKKTQGNKFNHDKVVELAMNHVKPTARILP